MSADFDFFCSNVDNLVAKATIFAENLLAGSTVALVGDLGMGKTHWTKGILAGLGSREVVTSPTFSLLQEYWGGRLPVFHFDLYRIQTAGEVLALGWDDYLEEGGVVIAEWADLFPALFPPETIWLQIREKEGGRQVTRIPSCPDWEGPDYFSERI